MKLILYWGMYPAPLFSALKKSRGPTSRSLLPIQRIGAVPFKPHLGPQEADKEIQNWRRCSFSSRCLKWLDFVSVFFFLSRCWRNKRGTIPSCSLQQSSISLLQHPFPSICLISSQTSSTTTSSSSFTLAVGSVGQGWRVLTMEAFRFCPKIELNQCECYRTLTPQKLAGSLLESALSPLLRWRKAPRFSRCTWNK